jgi:hypothetical protein
MDASRPVSQPGDRQHASRTTSLYRTSICQQTPFVLSKYVRSCHARATSSARCAMLPSEATTLAFRMFGANPTRAIQYLSTENNVLCERTSYALCIDQANVAERTHQVQQMGTIFSCATKVISWSGMSWKAAEFFREDSGNLASPEHATWFNQIEYWQRAWVTQEVILARQVTLMAGDSEMSMSDLPGYVQRVGTNHVIRGRASYNRDDRAPFAPIAPILLPSDTESVFSLHMMINLKDGGALHSWHDRGTMGSSLFFLLHLFRHQLCEIPRDRIFSLLALCGAGQPSMLTTKAPTNNLPYKFS